jgi:uncharacterized protein (DUF433 family)
MGLGSGRPRSGPIEPRRLVSVWVEEAGMGGFPCLRGTRVPVHLILASLAAGMTVSEVAGEHRCPAGAVRNFLRELGARFHGIPAVLIEPEDD